MHDFNAKLRTVARWSRYLPAALLLWASPSFASDEFPQEIQKTLDLACPPPCWLCHNTAQGGGPTPKPFAAAMIQRGLAPESPETVAPALKAIEMAGSSVDSDGDGTNDVEELKASRNPNVNGKDADDGLSCGPEYGCGARVAPTGPMDGSAMACALAAAAGLFAFSRRRRR
jgi:hypothetical protein